MKADERLLKQIREFDMKFLLAKVGFILSKFPETRNNDRLLMVELYRIFYNNYIIDGDKIYLESILDLPSASVIKRMMAGIQNKLGLFQRTEATNE